MFPSIHSLLPLAAFLPPAGPEDRVPHNPFSLSRNVQVASLTTAVLREAGTSIRLVPWSMIP